MDDSDDDFVTIGAPLQPLLDDEVPKKPKYIQQQTVTDAQGRRRFHGAFTGGFSAGFFNTVGSKEGWTPSAFVSARDRTSEEHATEQRPEDFMDDEDFGEYGIAPRQLTVSNDFQYQPNKDDPSGTTSTRDRKRKSAIAQAVANIAGIIPGLAPLESLVVPSSIPLGIQLLRKLGWKEGQGIGPRVRKPTRRKGVKDGKKVYGCSFPSQSLEDSESSIDEDFAPADVTFAPKDVCPIKFRPKNDLHGLGYSGINVQLGQRGEAAIGHISLFEPQAVTKKPPPKRAPRRGMMGAAFGVGALEDDDDEDVYAIDSMSNYDRVLTDASDKSYGWTAPKHTGMSSAPVGHLGKVLEGFKLSTTTLKPRQIFPPPTLPRDYKPIRKKTPGPVDSVTPTEGMIKAQEQAKKISFSLKPGSVSTEVLSRSGTGSKANAGEPASGSRQKLDAHARGAMLGEIESVFDLVKIKDKQRIEAMATPVTNREVSTSNTYPTSNLSLEEQRRLNLPLNRAAVSTPLLPQTGSITATLPTVTGTSMTVPTGTNTTGPNDTSVTGKAVPGSMGRFQPFAKDPTKQKRYERFLELRKLGVKYDTDVPGMTEWERQREREDFTRAAALYRPLAAGMASRFTPAQYEDDAKNVTLKKEKEAVDKRTCAVELKMFGRLTRETKEWHPDKQLCKLFNVANPYPGSSIVGVPGSAKGSASFATFDFAAGGTEQGNEEEEEVTEEDEERSTGKATEQGIGLRHTLIVGDSNLRSIVQRPEMAGIQVISVSGARLLDRNTEKWKKLMEALLNRLVDEPRVRLVLVHLGTNDMRPDLVGSAMKFRRAIDEIARLIRSKIPPSLNKAQKVRIVWSAILPRCPKYERFNETGNAAALNQLIEKVNKEIYSYVSNTYTKSWSVLLHEMSETVIQGEMYWRDSVHLSALGARILAGNMRIRIDQELEDLNKSESQCSLEDVIPADIKPLAFLTSGGLESLSGPSVRPESTGGNQAGSYVDLSEDVDSAEVKDEKVERPALDIFKAIFSSSESESEESDLEVTEVKRSDVTIPKVISDDESISGHMMRSREEDTIFAPMESEPRVPDRGSIAIESLEQRLALPGEGSTSQGEGQGHASFATPPDEIGDYGPALPPTFNTPANGQDRKSKSPKKKRLHKDNHKERKKKDKHKKNKSKDKKEKKKKKKKDRKKEVVMVSSSSSGSEADEDTDSDTDNQSIIDRLKNHPELKRMTAADFM